MAKYVVTGAMVQVKGNTADGQSAWIYAYRGAIVDLDAAAAKHLVSVELVQPFAEVDTDPVVAAGLSQASVPEVVTRPADDADQAAWVAFAVHHGMSQADAEKADREDLVAIFAGGGLDPEPPAKRTVTRKS